jgi:dienelactone hydrolase
MKITTPILWTALALFGPLAQAATSGYPSTGIEAQRIEAVEEETSVVLDASDYKVRGNRLRYYWKQTQGTEVRLGDARSAKAEFIAPQYNSDGRNLLAFKVIISNEYGYKYSFSTKKAVTPSQPPEPPELVEQRNENEFLIDGKYHPMGHELVAVIHFPEGASAENPVPGCAIVHGSGGLFKEVGLNQQCSENIENAYDEINEILLNKGVATILPSSFYSRNNKFCQDTENSEGDDYIVHGDAPFFNGDDVVARTDEYKRRRVAIRAMDMLATMTFFCDLEEVDCSKSCMVGTSNGATSILSYAAQSLPQDLIDFMDDDKRPFESNNSHGARNDAFENFPALNVGNITLAYQLKHRPLPTFAQLISPGCSMRDMVPDIEPGAENHPFGLDELYYPAATTQLTFEVGTADSIANECYINSGFGLRETQARFFEDESGIAPNLSQYIVQEHDEGVHNLLRSEFEDEIKDRLETLVDEHLLP